MTKQTFTAFPKTEQNLKEFIAHIDVERFKKYPIPACSFHFKDCLGMCCSLRVAVTQEEAGVLARLAKERARDFEKMGLRFTAAI